jgi:hypothetical protein
MLPGNGAYAQENPPAAPPPFSEESVARGKSATPADSYAADVGVSAAVARERLSLQDQAAEYAQSLLASNPNGFVDLEIRHTPNFKITVYYNKEVDQAALTRAAPVNIRRYLVFRPLDVSQDGLQTQRRTISEGLSAARLRFGLEFSLETGRFTLTIPAGADQTTYVNAIPQQLRSKVDIRPGPLAEPVAAVYGGWWFKTGVGGSTCTSGWPVRNSSGQESLLTAGHCGPPYEMYFSWNNGPNLTTVSSRLQDNTGYQTRDFAFYTLGTHTTARVINIQNDLQNADGSRNYVPGVVSAYYEIATPRQSVNGQYVCKQGGTTWLTCGFVVDKNWSGDGYSNVAKVSQSAQPYIALGGDSGGPTFAWSTDQSLVHPLGITIGSAYYTNPDKTRSPCKNASATASANTTCYFVYLPLTVIRAYSPFTVNTINGYIAP